MMEVLVDDVSYKNYDCEEAKNYAQEETITEDKTVETDAAKKDFEENPLSEFKVKAVVENFDEDKVQP